MEDAVNLIRKAIRTRTPISARYHDRLRLLSPHRLGRNKDGEQRVLCYQFGGDSKSGLKPVGSKDNWRCIIVEQLSDVKLINTRWRTAENHSRPASCITNVECDVEDNLAE